MLIWKRNTILKKEKKWNFCLKPCSHQQWEVNENLPYCISLILTLDSGGKLGGAAFPGPQKVDQDEMLSVIPLLNPEWSLSRVCLGRLRVKENVIHLRKKYCPIKLIDFFYYQFRFRQEVVKLPFKMVFHLIHHPQVI